MVVVVVLFAAMQCEIDVRTRVAGGLVLETARAMAMAMTAAAAVSIVSVSVMNVAHRDTVGIAALSDIEVVIRVLAAHARSVGM